MADEDRRPTRNLHLRSSAIVSISPSSSIAGTSIISLALIFYPSQLTPDVLPYVIQAPQPGIVSTSRFPPVSIDPPPTETHGPGRRIPTSPA
ncbi:hypothetical protein ABZX51_003719 [Aspergillus tubingensis]